jgi:pimeloyl-ACP methyl ester carboxylesterase
MDGSGEFFTEFAAALAPEVESTVVSYPQSELGYPDLAAHARKALPDRPHILVAESFSGPIAIALAASAPPGLRGVVLVCSFARSPLPGFLQFLSGGPPVWRVPEWIAMWMLLGKASTPLHRKLLAAKMHSVPPAVWRARMRAVISADVTSRLREVRVPILYLRALWDRVVPAAAGDWVLRNANDASVVDLEGPHFLLQARPRETAEHVKGFARRVGA